MNDQDEMFEAATELPAFLGCPAHMPKTLPGGFDGVEPGNTNLTDSTNKTNPSNPLNPSNPCLKVSDEARENIEASVARMRGKIEQIADIALAADAKCGVMDKLCQQYMAFSKAICEIRRICKESLVEEVVPDYERLAKIMTSDHFKPECLAKAIEAEASKRPIDYPTFYTPGWLCELAKKLQGNKGAEGVPPAQNKAAKSAEYMRRKYSFCDGLFPIRRANCEKAVTEHCWIGGRRFTMELSQDFHDDGEHVCCAKIRDNGNLVAKLVVYRGKSMAEHVSHAAFKAYVKNLCGSNKFSSRGGFLKKAIKRARVGAVSAAPKEVK